MSAAEIVREFFAVALLAAVTLYISAWLFYGMLLMTRWWWQFFGSGSTTREEEG